LETGPSPAAVNYSLADRRRTVKDAARRACGAVAGTVRDPTGHVSSGIKVGNSG